jgi:S-adenosylmethionine:tRNA ribosyltransferase-isomerase
MKVSDFDYDLPEELIAQQPLPRRDSSRMLVVDREKGEIRHSTFLELPGHFSRGDVLVRNETRVFPARIWGNREGRRIEFLFVRQRTAGNWEVLCRPAKRVQEGDSIVFTPSLKGTVTEVGLEGNRVISFEDADVLGELKKEGYAPLPPYIKRIIKKHDHLRSTDLERYQTVFARQGERSIAAPTAGLHFTPQLLEALERGGVETAPISLDVGLATFQPIRVESVEDHAMLEETYAIPEQSARSINAALKSGRPVSAVGTTSVRALESAAAGGRVQPGPGATRMFIYPGFDFQVVRRLLTNFHLPSSTLLMLTAAFGGYELIMQAYREAVRERYRFFSYGDCMLIK